LQSRSFYLRDAKFHIRAQPSRRADLTVTRAATPYSLTGRVSDIATICRTALSRSNIEFCYLCAIVVASRSLSTVYDLFDRHWVCIRICSRLMSMLRLLCVSSMRPTGGYYRPGHSHIALQRISYTNVVCERVFHVSNLAPEHWVDISFKTGASLHED
jgi:hypothetical protein